MGNPISIRILWTEANASPVGVRGQPAVNVWHLGSQMENKSAAQLSVSAPGCQVNKQTDANWVMVKIRVRPARHCSFLTATRTPCSCTFWQNIAMLSWSLLPSHQVFDTHWQERKGFRRTLIQSPSCCPGSSPPSSCGFKLCYYYILYFCFCFVICSRLLGKLLF